MQPLREISPKEVIYITLQEWFWVISIIWIVIQLIDKLNSGKK